MDKNQWYNLRSESGGPGEVYISYTIVVTVNSIQIPITEYLIYDGTVRADALTVTSINAWKVWQASPGSDLF